MSYLGKSHGNIKGYYRLTDVIKVSNQLTLS